MSLPELIEIVPPAHPIAADITVPGSKSLTNRALILAALSEGETILRGALWSEDTQVMVESLRRLGFQVAVEMDANDSSNRTLRVRGEGGKIPNGGTASQPLELFVGNAGTAARFLAALVCLGSGVYRLQGVARMAARPQAGLFHVLRQLGYRVESPNDRLPVTIHGAGARPGAASEVSIIDSSQFASALLLCARHGGWKVGIAGQNSEEAPYVVLTQRLIETFPENGGEFQVEADASSASYFCAANWLLQPGSAIKVVSFPTSRWQMDGAFPDFLPLPAEISRRDELGDSIMTAMILAPFASGPVKFTHLERLRLQECERVAAMRAELTRCGAKVVAQGETLTVFPSAQSLHGAEIETYDDHRMAFCFSILGLKIGGIKIKNPACVNKTFPNFYQKLAAPPPGGLGVTVRDASSGAPLPLEALFAEERGRA
jgi:3-phosphoshikimate 1-carboxyvinyltransferase